MADDKSALEQYELTDTAPESPEPAQETAKVEPEVQTLPKGKGGKFVSPRLVTQAKSLGISDEEIAALDSAELRDTINDALIAQMSVRQESRRANDIQAAAPPTPAPEPDPVEAFDWGADGETPLTEKDYPKPIQQLVKMVLDLKAQLKGINSHLGAQAAQTFAQKVDAKFASKPEIFGTGTVDEIDKNSPEFARRAFLLQTLDRFSKEPGTFDQKFDKAFQTAFGFAATTAAAPPTEPVAKPEAPPAATNGRITKEQWEAGSLGPTTQRNGAKEPKSVALAKKTFVNEMAKLKASSNGEDDDYEF